MHILIITPYSLLPIDLYGGLQRMAWSLGKGLTALGHKVSYLCRKGSVCDFATIITYNPELSIMQQIPEGIDVLHFNVPLEESCDRPYVETIHGNFNKKFSPNSIFLSKNHAERYGSKHFVYNGLDWDDYSPVDWSIKRSGFHFLGKAAWRVKNVRGAIKVAKSLPSELGKLHILGGDRFNFKMGWRFTLSPRIKFHGMVGGVEKSRLINSSNGLIFPVVWHEPFGLAVIESLFYGTPVFATTYGALPEIVTSDVGVLSNSSADLVQAICNSSFDMKRCHEYARDTFNAVSMAKGYIEKYEAVLNGQSLHSYQIIPQQSSNNTLLFK
ncbi:MAG: glycosyltransferase [Marinilabiliaceae bacterium]|nr:glycosyltransferase [Marinilabiliaceae bacterium]